MSSVPYSRYVLYPVPWYSFLIVTGIILAVIIACHGEHRAGLPKDTMIDLSVFLLPSGIIGARIYYVVFSWNQFRNDFWSVFRIWEGGIAIYGGIIGGFAALIVFCRFRKLSPLMLCDLIAPGVALAQSIGRWGNWFNIEAYGFRITRQAFCFFPLAVLVPDDGYSWHLASFFLESVWDFAIFLFLLFMRREKLRNTGDVFFFYVFLYAAGRLVIEETRLDSLYMSSSVRISQLLSILICIGVIFRYYFVFRKEGSITNLIRFFLFPPAIAGCTFDLLYSLFPALFDTWPRLMIFGCLSMSSVILIFCLLSLRFSQRKRRS